MPGCYFTEKKRKNREKKTTLCVSSVTVLLHGTTLDLGAPFNGGARGWFLSSPGTGTVWVPGGFQQPQTPWKVSSVRCGVSRIRIRPYISYTTPWLGTFIPRAACLGIWRILRRWKKEGIEFHLLFFYLDNNAWWEKKIKNK